MCGHTSKYKYRIEDIQDKVRVISVEENMREARLRLFNNMKRRYTNVQYGCERG